MDGVVGWFERRGEIPLAPPPRLREYGPLADDPDPSDANYSSDRIRGITFALEYCDSRGWASMRTVRCLALDPSHPASLKAYCNVRRSTRSFRLDRIVAIGDLKAGRILASHQHNALLGPYLTDEVTDPRMRVIAELRDATKNGVFALLHLAMANGRLGEDARIIVLDYVKAEAEALGCALPPADSIELWVDNLAPPLDAVLASVEGLLADKDKFARLLPWLLKVARCEDASAAHDEAMRELMTEVRLHYRHNLADRSATRALR